MKAFKCELFSVHLSCDSYVGSEYASKRPFASLIIRLTVMTGKPSCSSKELGLTDLISADFLVHDAEQQEGM
jgi:hypothetical protein